MRHKMVEGKTIEKLCKQLGKIIGKRGKPKWEAQFEAVKEFVDLNDVDFDFKRSLGLIIPKQFRMEDGLSHFARWLTYKITRVIDCDKSILAKAVYATLWYDADEEKDWYPEEFKTFSSDTMNSMATTLNHYMKDRREKFELSELGQMSTLEIARGFNKRAESGFVKAMGSDMWKQWNRFARNVSCVGNFALVPKGFNKYRHDKTQDYWDASLGLLHNGDFPVDGKKIGDKGNFEKYINTFFLWDYIGDESKPIELFERTDNSFSPKTEKEFQDFLTNVNRLIERRSIFMAAMLKIAVEQEDVYKAIMNELTSKDAIYASDLEKATEQLKEKFEESDENGILNDAIDKIKKIKLER